MENGKFFDNSDSFTSMFKTLPVDEYDTETTLEFKWNTPIYHDQLLPFDVSIAAQNEYGQLATMAIIGIEILNSGSGISTQDVTNEEQCTYIARHNINWQPLTEDKDTNYSFVGNEAFEFGEDFVARMKDRFKKT